MYDKTGFHEVKYSIPPANEAKFVGGAVRSADADGLDFTSIPIIGLIGVAKTAKEGATNYGRLNYMLGMSSHSLLNHAIRHIYLHLAGDRTEPNLSHAAWGIMAAIQSEVLKPEISEPHMLGPGMTLTDANRKELDEHRHELAEKRRSGEFAGLGNWNILDLPEVALLVSSANGNEYVTGLGECEKVTSKQFREMLENATSNPLKDSTEHAVPVEPPVNREFDLTPETNDIEDALTQHRQAKLERAREVSRKVWAKYTEERERLLISGNSVPSADDTLKSAANNFDI